jgi:8-oxo-dGTP pyrophosphatase MutT (NUDIX family)
MARVPVTPRLSSAIMLLRLAPDTGALEVFMVRRHASSDFAPDVYVFPGGSVTDSDRTAEMTFGVCAPFESPDPAASMGAGVRAAAIRELFEEAGVFLSWQDDAPIMPDSEMAARLAEWRALLQRGETTIGEVAAAEDVVLATDALVPCAHWITPEAFPKRFDTHFFLALHAEGQQAVFDALETIAGRWVRPAQALAAHERGEFPLVFATQHQLRDLAAFLTPQAALEAWQGRVPATIMPRVIQRGAREIILMPGEPEPAGG